MDRRCIIKLLDAVVQAILIISGAFLAVTRAFLPDLITLGLAKYGDTCIVFTNTCFLKNLAKAVTATVGALHFLEHALLLTFYWFASLLLSCAAAQTHGALLSH